MLRVSLMDCCRFDVYKEESVIRKAWYYTTGTRTPVRQVRT